MKVKNSSKKVFFISLLLIFVLVSSVFITASLFAGGCHGEWAECRREAYRQYDGLKYALALTVCDVEWGWCRIAT